MTDPHRLTPGTAAAVRVPATSANLGPGFDSLGLALELRDEVVLTVVDGPDVAEVTGEGAGSLPRDGDHLILRLAHEHLRSRGAEAAGLHLRALNRIPHARGLGSSAAAVVAAYAAAEALLPAERRRPPEALLEAATRVEGHPDNVAPALVGGATVSWTRDDAPVPATASLHLHEGIVPVVAIPDVQLSTHAARAVLPATVPHAVAAAQAGRTALLVHALAARPDLLLAGTRDWLHQDPRAASMPGSAALIAGLREGGHAAVVSGAGATVLALCDGAEAADRAAETARSLTAGDAVSWRVLVPSVAVDGVRVESLHHG